MTKLWKPLSNVGGIWFRSISTICGIIDACFFGMLPLSSIQISSSRHILFPEKCFYVIYGNPIYIFDTYVEVFLWSCHIKYASSIPGLYLRCFPVIIMTTFPQCFPGPVLIPCDLWIMMDLYTRTGMILDVQKSLSRCYFSTGVGTQVHGLSGKHFFSSGIKLFGKSTMIYEGMVTGQCRSRG